MLIMRSLFHHLRRRVATISGVTNPLLDKWFNVRRASTNLFTSAPDNQIELYDSRYPEQPPHRSRNRLDKHSSSYQAQSETVSTQSTTSRFQQQ